MLAHLKMDSCVFVYCGGCIGGSLRLVQVCQAVWKWVVLPGSRYFAGWGSGVTFALLLAEGVVSSVAVVVGSLLAVAGSLVVLQA